MQKLSEAEYEMAKIIWKKQPMNSKDLVMEYGQKMNWKKSTTYTMLKRMIDKGVTENQDSRIRMLVGKEEVDTEEAKDLLDRSFDGSLPGFVTAYMRGRKLSREDAEQLKQLICKYTENRK